MGNDARPLIDNPIVSSAEDVLARAEVAQHFARGLRELDLTAGLVVGVLGAWGSGKSSFVNLMREEFESKPKLVVVDFNPWMFSGAQQLVDVFFKEFAVELRLKDSSRFESIANGLDEYGDVLSPISMIPGVGAWWDRAFRSYQTARKWWKDRGAQPMRNKLANALGALDQPVVVVIDDIDRLSTGEIRDIFKLVRLTASFPNVIYVLSFDRKRAELALEEVNVPGRAYLEKIVQLTFDLPGIPRQLLRSQILDALSPIVDSVENVRFDQDRWPDIFYEIVEPSLNTLRDVTRYLISARPTLVALGSDIETVDLIALEAIRVFHPEVFDELQRTRVALTETVRPYGGGENSSHKRAVERLMKTAADADVREQITALLRRIFPAGLRYVENNNYGSEWVAIWKRTHRVAHLDFLNLYFERTAPSGLRAFRHAETAVNMMPDGAAFGAYLDSLDSADLEDVVSNLETYEETYPPEAVVPASIELFNRIAAIPERAQRGMLDFNRPDIVMERVVLRLLRRIESESDRESAARAIYDGITSYSSRYNLVHLVGHVEGTGHKLVSEPFVRKLESELISDMQSNHSSDPSNEWALVRSYWFAAESLGDNFVPIASPMRKRSGHFSVPLGRWRECNRWTRVLCGRRRGSGGTASCGFLVRSKRSVR